MNIMKLVNNHRIIDTFMKNDQIDDKKKVILAHDDRNIINVDHSDLTETSSDFDANDQFDQEQPQRNYPSVNLKQNTAGNTPETPSKDD